MRDGIGKSTPSQPWCDVIGTFAHIEKGSRWGRGAGGVGNGEGWLVIHKPRPIDTSAYGGEQKLDRKLLDLLAFHHHRLGHVDHVWKE